MTVKIRELHDRCPWAFASEHTEAGNIYVRVSLGGTPHLKPDEAAVTASSDGGAVQAVWPDAFAVSIPSRPHGLLERYVVAKGQGKHNGLLKES